MYYGVSETIKNIVSFFYTKIFWKKSRLIRRPIHVRGKRNMSYGKGLTIGYWGRISVSGKLIIGDNVTIGDFVQIEAHSKVEIGDNVLVASRVFISDTSHGDYSEVNEMNFYEAPNLRELSSKEDILGITFGLEKMYVYYQEYLLGKAVLLELML